MDFIFTLHVCNEVIRLHWTINGTETKGMGLKLFYFSNYCVLFSLARIGFPKKSDEEQIINKVHPNAENCLVFSTSRHYMDAVTNVEEDDEKQSIHWKRCGRDSPRFRIASP